MTIRLVSKIRLALAIHPASTIHLALVAPDFGIRLVTSAGRARAWVQKSVFRGRKEDLSIHRLIQGSLRFPSPDVRVGYIDEDALYSAERCGTRKKGNLFVLELT